MCIIHVAMEGCAKGQVLADSVYDSDDLRNLTAQMKAQAVIPFKRNYKVIFPHDTGRYQQRNRIE